MNPAEEVNTGKNNANSEQHYQVKAIGPIVGSLFLITVSAIIGLSALINANLGFSMILFLFAGLAFLRFRAIKDGISFNLESGEMSYPGGGVALNNLSDLVNSKYILQYFHRFNIDMNEIRSMSTSTKVSTSQNKSTGRISYSHTYYIEVNGNFGSSKISFATNEAKRDEAYSFIRQYNKMGSPIIFG